MAPSVLPNNIYTHIYINELRCRKLFRGVGKDVNRWKRQQAFAETYVNNNKLVSKVGDGSTYWVRMKKLLFFTDFGCRFVWECKKLTKLRREHKKPKRDCGSPTMSPSKQPWSVLTQWLDPLFRFPDPHCRPPLLLLCC